MDVKADIKEVNAYLMQKITISRHNIHTMKVKKKELKKEYNDCKSEKGRFNSSCRMIKRRIEATDESIHKEIMYRKKIILKLKKNSARYKKIYYRIKQLLGRM